MALYVTGLGLVVSVYPIGPHRVYAPETNAVALGRIAMTYGLYGPGFGCIPSLYDLTIDFVSLWVSIFAMVMSPK